MHREARKAHLGLGGVEALVVHDADGAAVQRVAPGGAVLVEVEQRRAVAQLLVGHKADGQTRMRDRGVVEQALGQGHDLGHARLVVGGQQRAAVGADDLAAHHVVKLGVDRGVGVDLNAVDHAHHELAALVVHDLRLHAIARHARLGVDVGVEGERGQPLETGGRRHVGGHVGVLGSDNVLGAHGAQLVGEQVHEVLLAGGGGHHVDVARVSLGVHLHIAQETLDDVTVLGFCGFAHREGLLGVGVVCAA